MSESLLPHSSLTLPRLLQQLTPLLLAQKLPIHLVGGAVRDAVMGRVTHDLDFVLPHSAIKTAYRVGNQLDLPVYVLDRERDVARVMIPEADTMLDFAQYRGVDLTEDLRNRDFTLNALALPVGKWGYEDIIDLNHGLDDLEKGIIRAVHPHVFSQDPLRTLRLVRQQISLKLQVDWQTQYWANHAAPRLDQVSAERIRDEWIKMMQNEPAEAMEKLRQSGIWLHIFPELTTMVGVTQSAPHFEEVWPHSVSAMRWLARLEQLLVTDEAQLENDPLQQASAILTPFAAQLKHYWSREIAGGVDGRFLLRTAALFHDAGKPATRTVDEDGRIRFFAHEHRSAAISQTVLHRLACSNEAVKHVEKIVAGHMRPLHLAQSVPLSRRAIYRFFRAVDEAGLDILFFTLADHLASHAATADTDAWNRLLTVVSTLLTHYFERPEETVKPPRLLDGRQLMALLQLPPGKAVGALLEALREAQAMGDVHTLAEAEEFVKSRANRYGGDAP